MSFKDAAFQILTQVGKPLHYTEITEIALRERLLETVGQTPAATMGALLYTDTQKPDSRFRRGDAPGTFGLKVAWASGIQLEIDRIQKKVREDLRNHLLTMHPQKFEELIRSLLVEMGFEEAETTRYAGDQGVDVRGVLKTNQLAAIKVIIQVKRWTKNVGSGPVRNLRGSLEIARGEQGIIITTSDFTPKAKMEAQSAGRFPITLINGRQLIDLLFENQVGVKQEQYTLHSIDLDYWAEVLDTPVT